VRFGLPIIAGMLAGALGLQGATLERLTLDEMIQKSTEIVRGRLLGSRAAHRGSVIYTYSKIQVLERWKGQPASQVEVAVPGGTLGGFRQTFSGVPELVAGKEYVLFLWTGRNGVTQVIGLSQGVLDVKQNAAGELFVGRTASTETMLDGKTGQVVRDEAVRMGLQELRQRVERGLATARQ